MNWTPESDGIVQLLSTEQFCAETRRIEEQDTQLEKEASNADTWTPALLLPVIFWNLHKVIVEQYSQRFLRKFSNIYIIFFN